MPGRKGVFPFRVHSAVAWLYYPMTMTSKLMAAAAVMISMAATQADAGQLLVAGYRHAPPYRYGYAPRNYRMGYMAPRSYAPQRSDLGAAIGGALAGVALQLIPRATEALLAKLPPEAPAPLPPPPVAAAQPEGSPPSGDALDDIQGNTRGITRDEVEAALVDWCASHGDAPLCLKLRVAPPSSGPAPGYAPPPAPYYRSYSEPGGRRYYRPGRFPSWNGCQQGWTVQDGLCKPYRGY
jgi:hypothetical protein